MDNLTHTFVGAAVSKAGGERLTPLATGTLVIAANAPDVDIVSYVGGPYFALSFRRGITHGWSAVVVLPFLVAAAVLAWDRWVRRARRPDAPPARAIPTLALSAVGVLTHPVLDWMNTYGMRWALPFDGSWSYGDALFIIDPWIWLGLGGAVFLTSRPGRGARRAWIALGLVASALVLIGMPPAAPSWVLGLVLVVWLYRTRRPATPAGGRALVAATLAVVSLYVGGLVVLDEVARADARRAAEGRGLTPRDVMVAPQRGRLLHAAVEVVTDDGYVPGSHRWLRSPRVQLDPAGAVPLTSGPASMSSESLAEVIARARLAPAARDYLVWSRYPYARVERDGSGWRVRFSDARYDDEPGVGSLAGVEVTVPGATAP